VKLELTAEEASAVRCAGAERVLCALAVEEAVRADLLIEDGDQMRFRHDLLREATRQCPQMGGDEGELGRGPDVSRRDVVNL
jgi:hypothetical protein